MSRAPIKKTFTVTWDRDLMGEVHMWMEANGYEKGDESAAFKALVRLGITLDPITAHLADAKARAYSDSVRHFNQEMYAFLGQLRDQYQESIKHTSALELEPPK